MNEQEFEKLSERNTSQLLVEQKNGLFVNDEYIEKIMDNKMNSVVLPRNYESYNNTTLYLCNNDYVYGVIKLGEPKKITKKECEDENVDYGEYWLYEFDLINKFERPKDIYSTDSDRNFKEVNFLFNREFDLLRDMNEYDVKKLNNSILNGDYKIAKNPKLQMHLPYSYIEQFP